MILNKLMCFFFRPETQQKAPVSAPPPPPPPPPPPEPAGPPEPEEEILGSDDEEQEDPSDYCKGQTKTHTCTCKQTRNMLSDKKILLLGKKNTTEGKVIWRGLFFLKDSKKKKKTIEN